MNSNIINNIREKMNSAGSKVRPFFFMIDFEMQKPVFYFLDELPEGIICKMPVFDNSEEDKSLSGKINLIASPVDFNIYKQAFDNVISNISHGNSYLLNLTFPTELKCESSLEEIFYSSRALYKLLYYDEFVVFSPEIFVRIANNEIRSYPMKGTIDASLENAEKILLEDEKEKSEHNTIIDLIRNDLSIYAENVRVSKYRYIDKIITGGRDLLQLSSEITGDLDNEWMKRIGDIIFSMLPAGSVSGAPKQETLRIISESELSERAYYTGVFGVFNGKELDSAVMIRYIEKEDGRYTYKSGGGITFMSNVENEYQELIDKVYVPIG